MISIHRYRRQANVTPKSYLSFLEGYKKLYVQKVDDLKLSEKKMITGLEKLHEASENVEILSKELVVKEKDLEVANQAADKVLICGAKVMEIDYCFFF